MIFQSVEKTLTDEEINRVMEQVSTDIRSAGWEVR
jgi:phenylalanyl-tRNA synthetase beta subunit